MEVTRDAVVWYYNGKEIDVYRDMDAAEAAVRRALRTGWSTNLMVDKDGSVMEYGIPTPHVLRAERRNMAGLVPGAV